MAHVARIGLLIAATAFLLTGCGVKGPLELPPEAKAQSQASSSADSGQGKAESAGPKPHKEFILDGLIR